MISRHLARKLVLMMIPSLDRNLKLSQEPNINDLVAGSLKMLMINAKNSLKDVEAFIERGYNSLNELELNHKDNELHVVEIAPVVVKTDELKGYLDLLGSAIELIDDSLDVPELLLLANEKTNEYVCKSCHKVNEVNISTKMVLEAKDYFHRLITDYVKYYDQIDKFIDNYSKRWKINRMISVDKNIIRLASLEAFYFLDTPINVAISEACILSNEFGDNKSTKFINGILANLEQDAYKFRFSKLETSSEEMVLQEIT